MPSGDLADIVSKARAFREVLRHHIELSTTPGYDLTLGWHQISVAANRATELLVRRDAEGQFADSLAANYCNVLEVCIKRLIGNILAEKDWDHDSIAGVEKAIEALKSHHARRQVDCREKQEPEAAGIDTVAPPKPIRSETAKSKTPRRSAEPRGRRRKDFTPAEQRLIQTKEDFPNTPHKELADAHGMSIKEVNRLIECDRGRKRRKAKSSDE
jgi:hypothetical protein